MIEEILQAKGNYTRWKTGATQWNEERQKW
jgi:hypothetical protein